MLTVDNGLNSTLNFKYACQNQANLDVLAANVSKILHKANKKSSARSVSTLFPV